MNSRILSCLKGLATGDAVGKQTEGLSRERVLRWYPNGVRGFEGPPGSVIPRYSGNTKREWRVGETTDDTETTIAVARAILNGGKVDHTSVGRELLKCRKGVHPGVRSLWEFHQAGDPARVATTHDGCGAAIRIAPVGIVFSTDRFTEITEAARQASIPTHGGALALAAAAATAVAVSAAIDGAPSSEIIALAERAAAESEGHQAPGTIARSIRSIYSELRQSRTRRAEEVTARYFPDGPLTIVPLAITIAAVLESAEEAILLAANIGGDSDSVASIAGAILGARCPATVNEDWFAVVERVNAHDLSAIAAALAVLRR